MKCINLRAGLIGSAILRYGILVGNVPGAWKPAHRTKSHNSFAEMWQLVLHMQNTVVD